MSLNVPPTSNSNIAAAALGEKRFDSRLLITARRLYNLHRLDYEKHYAPLRTLKSGKTILRNPEETYTY